MGLPVSRLARTGCEIRTVRPDLFVAIPCTPSVEGIPAGGRGLDRGVAITAVNAVIAYMVFVTELDRLLAFDPLARVPGRAADLGTYPKSGRENKDRAEDRSFRQRISAVMKNLWHRYSSALSCGPKTWCSAKPEPKNLEVKASPRPSKRTGVPAYPKLTELRLQKLRSAGYCSR